MTHDNHEPLIVELAPLPREQMGPFLLLGLDKDASAEQIATHAAERLAWAQEAPLPVSAEDINWAQDVLREPEARLRADVASLNLDLAEQMIGQLAARFAVDSHRAGLWQPIDIPEPADEDSTPLPDPEALRTSIVLPDPPSEAPAIARIVQEWIEQPMDPWAIELPVTGDRLNGG